MDRNRGERRRVPTRPRVATLRPRHEAELAAAREDLSWTVTDSLAQVQPVTSKHPAPHSTLDARGAAPPDAGGTQGEDAGRRHAPSLLWLVFLANAAVLAVALLLLTLSPITIDAPIEVEQFALLLAGLLAMLALNLVLLRRVLSPLVRLTEMMASIDPDRPGRRLSARRSAQRGGSGACERLQRDARPAGDLTA